MAIRYMVDETKGIVMATLNNCKYNAIDTANNWTGCRRIDRRNVETRINENKKYLIPNKFIGVAQCSPEDEWNEEVGKQIARDRLLNKYHNSLNKALKKINADIITEASNFNDRVAKKVAHTK